MIISQYRNQFGVADNLIAFSRDAQVNINPHPI